MKTAKHKQVRTKTRGRKAPAAHAAEMELGRVMYVLGGQPWIVEAAGKSQRWNKATGYFTHDNGGRPFYVKPRADGTITVFRAKYDKKAEELPKYGPLYDKVVCTIPAYEKLWVGANKGKYANKYEGENVGSSLLVHVHGNKYIYIGDRIIEFTAPELITEYHGIMGNSDVVYAFAKGDKNTYFFAGGVSYLPNTVIAPGDPYVTFYGDVNVKKTIKTLKGKVIMDRLL